ncbi:MAG TPA: endonuclease domain-containing protein [Thermodesulfovibrionales bacterium]|nr:endonuclease domain-containing protein [Thermodesulfovibrionales bacterium]
MDNSQKARLLRKNQTDAEKALWQRLRNRGLQGMKFRRQAPVGPYVADFLCESAQLIVEVDGGQHAENKEYDQYRDDFLRANGYEVIRFWNNEVLGNLDGVLEALTVTLSQRQKRSPHPNPLPQERVLEETEKKRHSN